MNEIVEISAINNEIETININFEISNQNSFAQATDTLKLIKTKIKQADDVRKTLVKPLNDHVKMINSKFAPILARLEELKNNLDKKMCAYIREERTRQEAVERERLKLEAEELRKKAELEKIMAEKSDNILEKEKHEINALLASSYAGRVERQEAVIDDKKICVSGNFAASTVRKTWTYEIVNLQSIPRQYLTYDDCAIKRAINSGVREIPGVRIFERETIMSR